MTIEGMKQDTADALQLHGNYMELGAVSPDLPYLAVLSGHSEEWGDAFHHHNTVETVRVGIGKLASLPEEDEARNKAMAWLFGYASHLVADMISHPVVARKVGVYEKHKREHRVCELNQDTYIFQLYFQDSITNCDYLKHGVKACTDDGRPGFVLASHLDSFWRSILADVYPTIKNPDPNMWYLQYTQLIDKIAEEGQSFVSVIRDIAEGEGYVYPETVDMTYIVDLLSPYGVEIHFDELFSQFEKETKKIWGQMARAVYENDLSLLTLANADLDTGISLVDNTTSIFWNKKEKVA